MRVIINWSITALLFVGLTDMLPNHTEGQPQWRFANLVKPLLSRLVLVSLVRAKYRLLHVPNRFRYKAAQID